MEQAEKVGSVGKGFASPVAKYTVAEGQKVSCQPKTEDSKYNDCVLTGCKPSAGSKKQEEHRCEESSAKIPSHFGTKGDNGSDTNVNNLEPNGNDDNSLEYELAGDMGLAHSNSYSMFKENCAERKVRLLSSSRNKDTRPPAKVPIIINKNGLPPVLTNNNDIEKVPLDDENGYSYAYAEETFAARVRLGDYTQPVDATNFKWGQNDEYCEPYVAEQIIKDAAARKPGLVKGSPGMDVDVGNSDYNHINGKSPPLSPDKTKAADRYDRATNWTNPKDRSPQSNVSTYEEPWDSRIKQRQLQHKLIRAHSEEVPPLEPEQDGPRRFSHGQGAMRRKVPVGDVYEDAWDTASRQKQLAEKLNIASKGTPTTRSPTSPLPPFPPAATYEEPWENRRKQLEIENRLEAARIHKSPKEVPVSPTPKSPARVVVGDTYEEAWDLKPKSKAFGYLRRNSNQDREHMPLPPSPGSTSSGSPTHKHSKQQTTCTIGERINPIIPLTKQVWYHGAISRALAENMLRVCKEGSYLVRESESEKGQYSLSIKSAFMNIHLRIMRHHNGMYVLGENSPPFREIPEMIDYYTRNTVPLKGANHLTLLHPVERP